MDPSTSTEGSLEAATSRMSKWCPEMVRTGPSSKDRGLFGQPKGLPWMLQVELWERFSYYGMRAILLYFIIGAVSDGGLGIAKNTGQVILAAYGAAVYLLAIPGGIVADRILGPWRSTLWGAVVIMAGHLMLSLPTTATAWFGICLVAIGTGFIKPNLSTIVGGLYDDSDPRRDSGFQYFYMAINIGSFFSPLVTGFLKNKWGFHAGFAAAAVGMGLALVAFIVGRKKMSAFAFTIPNPLEPGEGKMLLAKGGAVLAIAAAILGICYKVLGSLPEAIAYTLFFVATLAAIAYFTVMFKSPKVTPRERTQLTAYIPLWIGAVLFFMIFEQASGKMASFAADNTNGQTPFGFALNAEGYQAINPATVVILAPFLAWLWTRRAGKFPSVPAKFAFAVTVTGISALLMGLGFQLWPGAGKLSPWWFLAMVFVVQTVGELCLSPVGLATTTALAPKSFASQAMALWLLASAVGQGIAGVIIEQTSNISDATYYYGLGVITILVSLGLFALVPWTNRKLKEAQEAKKLEVA
ncbi:MAG: peptide MFS transporter [Propionibacteriaceae bacterium]